MDMTRHLRRWLNDGELVRMDGSYTGLIAGVTEERIRNRYTAVKQLEPVITFDDGWRLVPNIGMRRALIEMLGAETNNWIGHAIRVYRHRVQKNDGTTKWEKRVMRAEGCSVASSPADPAMAVGADDIPWGTTER
jgi:hypothetical protein